MNKVEYKEFKKEELGSTVFFILEKDGMAQIKTGELSAIIVVTEKAFTHTQKVVMGLEYITDMFLKIYNRESGKSYTINCRNVFKTYQDACEAFKKYIK